MASNEAEKNTTQDRAVVGSADSCDVRVDAAKVSRRHCAIYGTSTGYLLEDLNSRNGTYVDGKRIEQKTAVARRAQVTLSRSVPFPWDDVLDFFEGRRRGEAQPRRAVTIGRLDGNDLVLSDPAVSGRHARVVFEAGEVFIEDLGSRNGTYLNDDDTPVARALLRPGDVIRLGDTQLPAGIFFNDAEPERPGQAADDNGILKTALGEGPPVAHGTLDLSGRRGAFVLGRDPSCDFQLDYPMVSLRHAKLTIERTGATIQDLGSSNGTFVNGVRIGRTTAIRPRDWIALGSVWFVLSDDGLSLAPRAARGDITLEARDVGVTVAGGKRILENVSLAILPGELVGLMGPSGAGKSTLISALNGYQAPTTGSITINGRDLYENYDEFRGMIGYVPQDDIMHADLTVAEALYFSARLRLPTDYTDDEIRKRIAKVLADLGLQGTETTRIGNAERRGISGGQRKRVNVAMELLTDPPLLFLDEPTSGLSSEDALSLMRLLRQLADGGKTVILTIHQPSLDVYRLMDNLMVVGKDNVSSAVGRLVYSGPAFPDAIMFFEPDLPPTASPDAVLRGLGTKSIREWSERYENSPYHTRFVVNRLRKRSRHSYKKLQRRRRVGGASQYFSLVRRGLAVKLKDSWNTGVLLLQAPLIALLIGLVFGPKLSGDVTAENYADVARATATTMFLLGISALWFGCSNSARDIVAESAIYRRERMVGLGIPSYVASKVTILSLLCLFQCGVLLLVVGWLGSLSASWWTLYSALLMTSLVGVAIGLLVSAAARTGEVAAGVLPLVILPMVILGGILLPLYELPNFPAPMRLLASTMPSRWAFESLVIPEAQARPLIDGGTSPPTVIQTNEPPVSDADTRRDMADAFFKQTDRWRNSNVLAFLVLLFQMTVCLVSVGCLLLLRDTV
jgi:ABC-type multidrug transport system ATPase subunit/pSer/pThr/pTyr-binding forkhead associated (FHA) protein/ABC-type multidrug transport system permease subunit